MRCFTDPEIRRGLEAAFDYMHQVQGVGVTMARVLDTFLKAAQPTAGATDDDWPTRHPMHCRGCGRALTDPAGTALVNISIVERQWRCDGCASG